MSGDRPRDLRKGWCPGVLRPMAAADGLVVRLRPTGGILSAATARAIADLAARHGNGKLDLTARANLQLRGMREETLPTLVDGLRSLGLVDCDAAAEAVRNVMGSPLAGLHDGPDIRPLVASLETRLAGTPALRALPTKFGFLVDDGSTPSLADVPADVRFDWRDGAFEIGLGGTRAEALALGICPAAELVDRAEAIGRRAVELFAIMPDARRMRTLIDALDLAGDRASVLLPLAGASQTNTPSLRAKRSDPGAARQNPGRERPAPSGLRRRRPAMTIAAPYGRLDAAMLHVAAALAAQGAGELRLTPWRSLLVPGLDAADVAAREEGRAVGFIVDPSDPRLRVAACVGTPDCGRATTATRADADALADLAAACGPGPGLHVSGCAKGCAHAGRARATLVARDGTYDLVVDGRAGDPPSRRGLDLPAARAALATLVAA